MASFDSQALAPAPGSSRKGKGGGRKGGSSSGGASKSKSSVSAEEQERKDFEASLASPLGINGALFSHLFRNPANQTGASWKGPRHGTLLFGNPRKPRQTNAHPGNSFLYRSLTKLEGLFSGAPLNMASNRSQGTL